MSDTLLPAVELEPREPAQVAVIWLHGLGADGHDFEPLPAELGLGADPPIRWVFPHAPRVPVSLNYGLVMPAWYDIRSLDERGQDEAGIRRSAELLEALVAREKERGIPPANIFLAGFSQGGAVTLFTALRYPERLAGVIALSTYLVLADAVEKERSAANRGLPIFLAHGLDDPMVPHLLGLRSRARLETMGYAVEWHEYPMPHSVSAEEIRDLARWLRERLEPDS